ncbi:MAG: antibiotic biosynthesis monooxygenase [Rickettsiales bacterium]
MIRIIWKFKIHPEHREAFEALYGAEGAWAQLFRRVEGYVATKLLRDTVHENTYLTIDTWRSTEDFETFKRHFATEYDALDKTCEAITENETKIGVFDYNP